MRTGLLYAVICGALAGAAACSTASPSASGTTETDASAGETTTGSTGATADETAGEGTTAGQGTTTAESDSGESEATTAPAGPCELPLDAPLNLAPGLQGTCGFTTTHYGRVATDNVRECLDPSCNTCTNKELFPLEPLPPDALPPGACVHFEHRSETTTEGCETVALALWADAQEGPPLLLVGARLGSPEVLPDVGLPELELSAAQAFACACEGDEELGCCGGELNRLELELTPAGGAPVTIAPGASASLSLGDEDYTAHVTVAHTGSSCDVPREFVTWFLVHS